MFKTCIATGVAGVVLVVATGCGVVGTWVFCDSQPVAAGRYYTFGKVTFNPDASFLARGKIDGRVIKAAGTYRYNCCRKRLELRTGDKELVYRVRVLSDDKLAFEKELADGTKVAITLARQRPCPESSTGGPCRAMYRKYRPSLDDNFSPAEVKQTHRSPTPPSACCGSGS